MAEQKSRPVNSWKDVIVAFEFDEEIMSQEMHRIQKRLQDFSKLPLEERFRRLKEKGIPRINLYHEEEG